MGPGADNLVLRRPGWLQDQDGLGEGEDAKGLEEGVR